MGRKRELPPQTETAERISQIVGERPAVWAAEHGLSPSTVRRYVIDRDPAAEFIRVLIGLGYDPVWVLTGRGSPRFVDDAGGQVAEREIGGDPIVTEMERLSLEVSRLRERVMQGEARYQPKRLEFLALPDGTGRVSPVNDKCVQLNVLDHVPCPPTSTGDSVLVSSYVCYDAAVPHPADSACCYLDDDGMAPTLPRGALVCVDRHDVDPHALDGQIVAVTQDRHTVARRLRVGGEHYTFCGDGDVDPIVIPLGDTPPIAGRVIWAWIRMEEEPCASG